MQSGYYRTLNDSKVFDVPWPNDFVYRKNCKKGSYDTLSVPEFVQGYCAIVVANIPVLEEMKAAIDHVGYVKNVVCRYMIAYLAQHLFLCDKNTNY